MKILVIPQTNRIGDIICATPVFRAIKQKYPGSRLVVLVSKTKGSWEIIKNNPRVDEIIFYEDAGLIKKIRNERFDWSFNLTNYPVPSPIAFLGLIPNRVKTVIQGRSLSEILTDRLNTDEARFNHHTDVPRHYLSLIGRIGINNAPLLKEVFMSDEANKKAENFFNDHNLNQSDLVIGISVTAGNKVKEWPLKNFAIVANGIIERYRAKVVFAGSKRDLSAINEVLDLVKNRSQCFVADLFSVEELPSLMKGFNLFISADTGPIHIAEALGVPLVDIMGPVDPREIAPRCSSCVVVLPPAEIPPSVFIFKKPGSVFEQRRAIEAITVQDVLLGIKRAMVFVKK